MTAEGHPPLDRWERLAEWPLAAVSLLFLASYSIQVISRPHGMTATVMDLVTTAAWAVFVIDYVIRLWLADHRWRWFYRHPLDLAVIALPLLRPFRLIRLIVLVTALQKAVGNAIRGRVIVYTVSGAVLLTYVASLAVLDAERSDPRADITNFGEALWWSVSTITTVGYGDRYPVTTVGRVVAVLLMIGGISLVGSITATIASWIVQRVAEVDSASQAITTADIEELRHEIHALRAQLRDTTAQTEISTSAEPNP